jgi:hypothetical protein
MYEESIAAARKMLELPGVLPPSIKFCVPGWAYAFAGNRLEAEKMAEEAIALSMKTYISPGFIALIFALLNEKDSAFEWLGKSYEGRDNWLYQVKVAPYFDNLRPDPRFKELLKKMGLEWGVPRPKREDLDGR